MPTAKANKKKVIKHHEKRTKKHNTGLIKFLFPNEYISQVKLSTLQITCGILLCLLILFIYLRTLYPTIGLLDSGDMVTSAYTLGIPHPPGYPLYCLTGKIWISVLPVSNIAFRMNVLSAISAAIACMMIYFIVLKIITPVLKNSGIISCIPAMVSGFMLAFAPTFWKQATIAEKYTLNAVFATLLIFVLIKWYEYEVAYNNTRQQKNLSHRYCLLFLFAFLLGLGFTHHLQTIFLIPASIYLIFAVNIRATNKIKYSAYFKMIVLFILPLLLYLYLPIRASVNPPANWGDPDTWEKFINHVTAKQYGYYFTSAPKELIQHLFEHLTKFFPEQFTLWILWLGIIGCIYLFNKYRRIAVFLCLIVCTDIAHSIRYDILNIDDYYIPAFAIFSIWIGIGIVSICEYITNKFNHPSYGIVLICISILIPLLPFCQHYYYQDKSRHYFAYDSGVNILRIFKDAPVVFSASDDIGFPLWYLLRVENRKPNTILVSKAFLQYPWYTELLKVEYPKEFAFSVSETSYSTTLDNYILNFIRANITHRHIYLEYEPKFESEFSFIPAGLFCQVVRKLTYEELKKVIENIELNFILRGVKDKSIYKDWRTNVIFKNYAAAYSQLGSFCGNAKMYDKAEVYFQKAIELSPDTADHYLGLGMVMEHTGRIDKAKELYHKAIKLNPDDTRIQTRLNKIEKNTS